MHRNGSGVRGVEHPLLVQLARYAVVGGLGTGANALIFLISRSWFDAMPANLLALVLSTALSTEVNRRFTFGAALTQPWRSHVQTGGTVVFYAFYSSAVLLLLGVVVDGPTPVQESLAVVAASVLGGIVRFLVLRFWVFGSLADGQIHGVSVESEEVLAGMPDVPWVQSYVTTDSIRQHRGVGVIARHPGRRRLR